MRNRVRIASRLRRVDERDQSHRDRHHHGSRCRVAHEGREERGGQHQAENHPLRSRADETHHDERDAAVKTPAHHAASEHERTEEEEHGIRGVRRHSGADLGNLEKREEHHRQHGSYCDRHCFKAPPDGHPDKDAKTGTARGRELRDRTICKAIGRWH